MYPCSFPDVMMHRAGQSRLVALCVPNSPTHAPSCTWCGYGRLYVFYLLLRPYWVVVAAAAACPRPTSPRNPSLVLGQFVLVPGQYALAARSLAGHHTASCALAVLWLFDQTSQAFCVHDDIIIGAPFRVVRAQLCGGGAPFACLCAQPAPPRHVALARPPLPLSPTFGNAQAGSSVPGRAPCPCCCGAGFGRGSGVAAWPWPAFPLMQRAWQGGRRPVVCCRCRGLCLFVCV